MPGVTTKQKTCAVEDCMTVYVNGGGKGYCPKHYSRWYKHGDPNVRFRGRNDTLEDRLRLRGWDETAEGCWEFRGAKSPSGYGSMHFQYRTQAAHRWAYMAWVGPIPEGHVVRHKCDNPPCINPDHLETGTHADNSRDMRERGRNNHVRKLNSTDVVDIRWLHCLGARQVDIARAFNVSKTAIRKIVTHQRRVEN